MKLNKKYTQIVTVIAMTAAAPVYAGAAARLAADMEGVYRHRFANGLVVDGGTKPEQAIISEDVVEVVRYDASSI